MGKPDSLHGYKAGGTIIFDHLLASPRCNSFVHSQFGFARDIKMHMRKGNHGKVLNVLRVDEKIKDPLSFQHKNSHAELAKLLDERRRQCSTIKRKKFRP